MKKNISKKIIARVGTAFLSLCILFGSFVWVAPIGVSASEADHGHKSAATPLSVVPPETTFDPYVTPHDVEGRFFMGTEALKSPLAVSYSENGISGTYYKPNTYIYFGEAYQSSKGKNAPIVLRVLDADRDNAGNGGAMFVVTEEAHTPDTRFSMNGSGYVSDLLSTQNIYGISIPHHFLDDFAADNYRGNYKVHFNNRAEELDYIRPVTVTDELSEMNGIYGYGTGASMHWEVDLPDRESNTSGIDGDRATYIVNERFFLLSAKEMNDYISNIPFAPGMAAKVFGTDNYVRYWLRTGLDFGGSAENGKNVGAVDSDGNVVPLDAENSAYVRYGFNIETSDLAFMYSPDGVAYRLTFLDPTYKAAIAYADPENGVDDRFAARVLDVKGGLVTLEVWNAIRNRTGTSYSNVDENLGVSVIIKDKASGAIKYYGQIEDNLYTNSYGEDASAISAYRSKVYFRLPAGFDHDSDEVHVFWEMSQDTKEGATFISNMVKLDCLHPDASEANCISPAICPNCGEFGEKNENNHENVDTSVYYKDEKQDIHWNKCEDCQKEVNVEACVFGENCSVDCVCGNSDYPADQHDFDENGICNVNAKHFEPPTIEYNTNLRYAIVRINNEGQLIAFAKLLNGGMLEDAVEFSVFIEADLNFAGISGFVPIGTEEYPFCGEISGNNFKISNISFSGDGKYAGIFGYADWIVARYLTVENCSFEASKYAGIIAGKVANTADEAIKFHDIEITDCTVNAVSEDGKEGILIGEATDNLSVSNVYSYMIRNSDGELVRFFSDPEAFDNITVERAVCLYGENGEYGERDTEAYASGEVAHLMGKGQKIGEDAYPSTDTPSISEGTRVFKVTDCAGELLRYTNQYLSIHNIGDYTEHRITEFYEFIWDESLIRCEARVYCAACDRDLLVDAETEIVDSHAPVRVDYVARVTVNGEVITSEPHRYIGTRLEDMIGMTNKTVEFDGSSISPEWVLDNHRLPISPPAMKGFEAYFLDPVTGDRLTEKRYDYYGQEELYPASVYLPGTYDLLVVGKNAYEGQEYTYEDALTIIPVTANVTLWDVYKYYDGNGGFEPTFTVDLENYEYIFDVELSEAPSSEQGEYDLTVKIKFYDRTYAQGVNVVLSRETVKGRILPQLQPIIKNKNYPVEFTYGDVLPNPLTENFTVSEGCELTFEWLVADYNGYGELVSARRLASKPQNAGEYILRVSATGEGYVSDFYDLPITINRKQLALRIEGAEPISTDYYDELYVIDMGQTLSFTIEGFVNGDSAESVGAYLTYYQSANRLPAINDRYIFPYQPNSEIYEVAVYGDLWNYLSDNCNYERAHKVLYVTVNAPDAPTPVFGDDNLEDGEKQEFGIVYSWAHPISFRDGERVILQVNVTKDGEPYESYGLSGDEYLEEKLWQVLTVTDAGEYNVNVTAGYANDDTAMDGYNVDISFYVDLVNPYGESLDYITDMGDYTVTVTSGDEARELDVAVCREIPLTVKPFDYEESVGYPEFEIRNFIMEAGKVVRLGHEIVDVDYEIYTSSGQIRVSGITVLDGDGNDVSHLYKVAYGGYTTVHVYDSPCDATCNVEACDHVRGAEHTGGVATCTSFAECESCGALYGELAIHRHTSDSTVCTPDPDDLMSHRIVYACCGMTKNSVGHVEAVAATCTSLAICADCDWAYGVLDPDNHSSDGLSYTASEDDATAHVVTHACCGASFTEAHAGGVATCTSYAICEKCNTAYGELDENNHADITYTANAADISVHDAKCADCEEEWSETHIGGAATCLTLAVCEKCDGSYGELDPDNHESDETKHTVREENPSMHDLVHSCCEGFISKAYHSGGEANCASAAICEFCSVEYGKRDETNHTSDEVAYKQNPDNAGSHVKYRVCCNEQLAVEDHSGENSANCDHGNICDVCGIEWSEKLGHVYDDEHDVTCNACEEDVPTHVVIIPAKIPEAEGESDTDNAGSDSTNVGCESSVSGSAMAIIAFVGAAIVLFRKKEEI